MRHCKAIILRRTEKLVSEQTWYQGGYRANIVTYYFLTQFLLIVIVLATGVAGLDALARAVVLFPVMVLGAWIGGRAFHGLASERLYRNVALGGVMALAMILNLVLAAVMGVTIPWIRTAFGKDPAVGSSVLITACTDSGGFFIFLGLATLFLM